MTSIVRQKSLLDQGKRSSLGMLYPDELIGTDEPIILDTTLKSHNDNSWRLMPFSDVDGHDIGNQQPNCELLMPSDRRVITK